MKYKSLIVEDDNEIRRILADLLEKNGYTTVSVSDGNDASEKIKTETFDMILMDLMLPGKNGEELIRELREISDTPVIVISAKSVLETRLEVLRTGADDYIIKPFDLDEVLVRLEVILRRTGKSGDENISVLEYEGLKLFTNENRTEYHGEPVSLTAKEMMILRLFLEHPKKVYTKANLYESVWNDEYIYEDNTVNVHVSNLRSKLRKSTGLDIIETVWGIGYRLKGE